jgi:maltose/moltooligosaccharide transporter
LAETPEGGGVPAGGAPSQPQPVKQVLENASPRLQPESGRLTVGTLAYSFGGLAAVFCWLLLGDFAFSMRERSADPTVKALLAQYGASNTFMTVITWTMPMVVGLLLSPVISYKSDRYRSRFGRRIPFLAITTPVTFLSMLGLAYSPMFGTFAHNQLGESSPGLSSCILGAFAVFYTFFELATITSLVLFGALVNDVVPRAVIGRFYALFRAVSLVAGIIFNRYMFAWMDKGHFFEMFLGISVFFGLGFALMCWRVKEGEYPPPSEDPDDVRGQGFFVAAGVYFKECFSSGYYWLLFVTFFVTGFTFAPYNSFSQNYNRALCIPIADYGAFIAYSYVVSLTIAYPLGSLVDRFHPLRVGIVAMLLYVVSMAYGAYAVHDRNTFLVALVLHTILSGTYFTATAALGAVLFPRVKFGQFASASGIIGTVGGLIFGTALGPILDLSARKVSLILPVAGYPGIVHHVKVIPYGLVFWLGLGLSLLSIILLLLVYRRFMRLGGTKNYKAPEPHVLNPAL